MSDRKIQVAEFWYGGDRYRASCAAPAEDTSVDYCCQNSDTYTYGDAVTMNALTIERQSVRRDPLTGKIRWYWQTMDRLAAFNVDLIGALALQLMQRKKGRRV